MSVNLKSSGDLLAVLSESYGANQLNGTKYTKESPYIIEGTKADNYITLDNQCQVIPGKVYYLAAVCEPGWADKHLPGEAGYGLGTIWLYLSQNYDASSYNYNTAVCFNNTSTNKVAEGVWKYTIPTDRNMARIRLNTYSDGSETTVQVKWYNIALIAEEDYVGPGAPSARILSDTISVKEIFEM